MQHRVIQSQLHQSALSGSELSQRLTAQPLTESLAGIHFFKLALIFWKFLLCFTCGINYKCFVLIWTLTQYQICDLPPGTISDITNEHNLTVHWTEKHTHRDCALYTGETLPSCHVLSQMFVSSSFLTLWTFQRSNWELVQRLSHGSGALQVTCLSTPAAHCFLVFFFFVFCGK